MRDTNRAELAEQAADLVHLSACPLCGHGESSSAFDDNDITGLETVPEALWHSRYEVCHGCAGIYAAWRQVREAAERYYALFPELEHRSYANKPPSEAYQQGKTKTSRWLAGVLDGAGIMADVSSLLHIRCDCGTLGPVVRERWPDVTVTGGDYFQPNIDFARRTGNLDDTYLLNPQGIKALPGRGFDLILINHMFTHALSPQDDMAACLAMLKPGGYALFYNEIDFAEQLRPGGRYFRLARVNNYHKQLFSPATLTRFLQNAGFELQPGIRRKNTLTYLGQHKPGSDARHSAAQSEVRRAIGDLAKWNRYRRSPLAGPVMRNKIGRTIYKKLASKPAAL